MGVWNATTAEPILGSVGTKATKAKGRAASAERRPSALTPRQERFVAEYLVDRNGKQAAIRAGYSPRSAEVTASKLLSNPKVREVVERKVEAQAERLEVKADTVLRELLRIATADIGEAFDANDNLKPMHEIPEEVRRAIGAFEFKAGDDGITRKVKFWDKNKALESLGRHLKLFTDKVEHDVSESLGDLVLASMGGKK